MYTFTFIVKSVIDSEDLTISVFGEDYTEAIDKIREMKIPELKKNDLILSSVIETYDEAMYFSPEFDLDDTEDDE